MLVSVLQRPAAASLQPPPSPVFFFFFFFFQIVPETDEFLNTWSSSKFFVLFPLHVFGVRSLGQAGVVGTLAGVTLARRPRRPRLAPRTGVSRLSLGSSLSRAPVFSVTRNTSWT